MNAMIAARYGGPETMQLQEVPTPTIGDDEVLVGASSGVGSGTRCGDTQWS
jgi:hypothetical protein